MIYKDRTYRNTEETSTSTPKLEGALAALENFGGGKAATEEIRRELNITDTPPAAPASTEPATTKDINADLGQAAPASAEPATPAATTGEPPATTPTEATTTAVTTDGVTTGEEAKSVETLKIESAMFEGGALDLGVKNPKDKTEYTEDVTKFITDSGYESPEALRAVLDEHATYATQVTELTNQVEGNNQIFQQMPKEMYNAMTAFFNGDKAWKNHVTNDGVDYAKDVTSYNTKDMVDTFFPGEFSKEDWEEFGDVDGDVNIKKAINIAYTNASGKFEAKQNEITTYQSGVAQKQSDSRIFIDKSIGSTIGNLSNQMKGLSDPYVKSIESKIRNNEIMSLFYEKDGSLKQDAAHRFILAQDGNDLIEKYQKLYEVRAQNIATQDILDRTPSTPDTTQGGSSTAKAETKSTIQQGIEALESRFNKKNTF